MIKHIRKSLLFKPASLSLCGVFIFQLFFPAISYGLTSGPSTPEVQSFEPVGTTQMVDPFTGDFNYNIPLLDVGGYPVNLHYHAGIGMDQEASWVGLGWNINPGVVNRAVRGIPDDFDGSQDQITYKYNVKDNITVGLGLSVAKEIELFGFTLGGNDMDMWGTSEYGFNLLYNNYRGVGYSVNADYKMSFCESGADRTEPENVGQGNANLGFSSFDGFDVDVTANYKKSYVGIGYNSREGLNTLKLAANIKGITVGINSSGLSLPVPLANPSYTPVTKANFSQFNGSFTVKVGGEGYGIFPSGAVIKGFVEDNYIAQHNKSRDIPAFGYLYAHDAGKNSDVVLDKQHSGDYSFDRFTKYIGASMHSYDVYGICGQGIAGQYRPYRNQFGLVWEPGHIYSNGTALSGIKPSLDIGAGDVVKIGGTIDFDFSWGNAGTINLDKKDRQKLGNNYFSNSTASLTNEPVYFKDMANPTMQDDAFYNALKQEQAVKVAMYDFVSDFAILTSTGYAYSTVNKTNVLQANEIDFSSGNTIKNGQRVKRQNMIQYLNGLERASYGVQINRVSPSGGLYPNSYDIIKNYSPTPTQKPNHVSEITTFNQDGSRYVYGLPAYNNTEHEATFSEGSNTNSYSSSNSTGLITYTTTDASMSNSKGLDHYYQYTETPAHAYAYHLTAILSPDYADITGDGPTPDDFGQYTLFNYDIVAANYKWRSPFTDAGLNRGLLSYKSDDKAGYLYGEKDVWMLTSIETKTHIALFINSDRLDGFGAFKEENLGSNPTKMDAARPLKKLDEIRLYTREQIVVSSAGPGVDRITPASGEFPIKTVKFEYSYDLCGSVPNNSGVNGSKTHPLSIYNINSSYNHDINTNKGKLTLHKVSFTYGFSDKGSLNPYLFEYKNNVNYANKSSDRWGNYQANTDANGGAVTDYSSNSEFPYTRQNSKATADLNASMWALSTIYLPSGGKMDVEYESDDYAYVQDMKAMQMIKITGFKNDLSNPAVAPTNMLYDKLKTNKYIVFPIDPGYTLSDYIPDDMNELYYNMLVDLTPYDKSSLNHKEYIQGYCVIAAKGTYTNSGTTYGYILTGSETVSQKNSTSNVTPQFVNPISGSAFQFIRFYMPWMVNHGSDWNGSDYSAVGKTLGTVFGFVPELVKTIMGYNFYLRVQGYANKVDLNYSFIKVTNPKQSKLGGGHRVKSVKINDNWNTLSGETSQTYGQVFDYTMPSGIKTISSGVASYEPLIGGDEIPQRKPSYRKIKNLLTTSKYLYDESPILEDFYPSASVGYSRVTVRNLKPSDISLSDQITRHAMGSTVYEYYTAKDFPTKSSATPLDKFVFKPSVLAFIGVMINRSVATQGFAIELNDMHGKPKAVASLSEGGDYDARKGIVSMVQYVYKTSNGALNNQVNILNSDGTVGTGTLGVDIETVAEPLKKQSYNLSGGANIDLDGFVAGIVPAIVPTMHLLHGFSELDVKTVSTTKVVQRYGILDKVIAYKNGSSLETKNLAWDPETGQVLLTSSQTQYGDNNYNMTMPAHYAYEGMDGAYKNLNTVFTGTVVGGKVTFSDLGMFVKGDELSVYNGTSYLTKAWVLDIDPGPTTKQAYLIDKDGNIYPNGSYTFKVLRSGHRNMQTNPVGGITLTQNPIVSGRYDSYTGVNNTNILDAQVVQYKDGKALYPMPITNSVWKCDTATEKTFDYYDEQGHPQWFTYGYRGGLTFLSGMIDPPNRYFPTSTNAINPYKLGVLGTYFPWRTLSYYDKTNPERQLTSAVNPLSASPDYNLTDSKNDGRFQSFTPFWSLTANYYTALSIDDLNNELFDKWTWTSSASKMDQHGNEIESYNPLEINSAVQYGYNKKFKVAVASNARHEQVVFDGFEEYYSGKYMYTCPINDGPGPYTYFASDWFNKYNNMPWHWYLWPNLTPGNASVTNADAHTGKQSLKIETGAIEIPMSKIVATGTYPTPTYNSQFFLNTPNVVQNFYPNYLPTNSTNNFLLTYWAKYDKTVGIPEFKLQYYNGGWVNIGSTDVTEDKVWVDGWQRNTIKITIPAAAADKSMRLLAFKRIYNPGLLTLKSTPTFLDLNNFSLLIDDIRIMPDDANMQSFVYDNLKFRLMATLNENHFATFYEYDDEGTLVRTKKETERGIVTIEEARKNIMKR